MPRQKSLVTVIRDMVQQEVGSAIQSLLGGVSGTKPKTTNGRVAAKMAHRKKAVVTPVVPKAKTVHRRRRRRRGPGRPAGSKRKAA